MGDDIQPVQYDRPPDRVQIPIDVLVQAATARRAAEELAGLAEAARALGVDVAALEKAVEHLAWSARTAAAWAEERKAEGWQVYPSVPDQPRDQMS